MAGFGGIGGCWGAGDGSDRKGSRGRHGREVENVLIMCSMADCCSVLPCLRTHFSRQQPAVLSQQNRRMHVS